MIMKNLKVAFRLTIVMCVLLSFGYVAALWLFAKVAGPGKGNAEVVELNGKVVGAANVGQQFTKDIYFWGRPSCAGDGYDAANSCGSNKGPTNIWQRWRHVSTHSWCTILISSARMCLLRWLLQAVRDSIPTSLLSRHVCR